MTRGEDNAVQFYINGELDSHHEPESGFNDPHFLHIITLGARTQGRGTYQNWFTGAQKCSAPRLRPALSPPLRLRKMQGS